MNVTADQIKALRTEAANVGDADAVKRCNRALRGNKEGLRFVEAVIEIRTERASR